MVLQSYVRNDRAMLGEVTLPGSHFELTCPGVAVQLLAHHLMRSGLLLAETGVATLLVARSAACSVPVVWRVSSLAALHLVVTLGPTLLPLLPPLLGGADGSWAPWLVAALAPLPLLSLVPPV